MNQFWGWVLFHIFVFALLILDMKFLHRKGREVRVRDAFIWSIVWILLALAFNAGVYFWMGREAALQFLTGYIIERSLSMDNLFVFMLIFTYFRVPAKFQHSILFWGILGALLMRGLFILCGVTLLDKFEWVLYIFGAFLVWSGVKLCLQGEEVQFHPEKSRALRLVRRIFPLTEGFEEGRFFVRRDHRIWATMMFLVLVAIETTDLVFALDSLPAILVVTKSMFIAYTSNVFAIIGLRALYFAIAGLMAIFHYLNYGLAVVLAFIGVKMLIDKFYPIPTALALGAVVLVLLLSVLASILWPKKK